MNGLKIIAIEGLDKAGKNTAQNVLREYFACKGLVVETASFPNYDSPTGKLIQEWLKGTFQSDTKTFELLQAADKQHGQVMIQDCEDRGVDILLVDRYVHTELAYGVYDNDQAWLEQLTRYLRLPDKVVYMDVEPEVSMHRRGKYGDNDYYESDLGRLRYTRGAYEKLFEQGAIPVERVDANMPPLIVKAQVLQVACHTYREYTGVTEDLDIQAMSDDMLTPTETELLRAWEASRYSSKPTLNQAE